jgi:hypothetical protein
MAFEYTYRVRSNEQWEKRANQSGGNFIHFIKDEYRLFTPQKGENLIRVLPPSSLWKDAPHAGLDVHVHYGVGPVGQGGSVICLNLGAPQIGRSGEPCPICQEHAKALRAQDEKLSRDLRPVKRVVTFILNRHDESQGPLIWAMPFTVDRDIGKISRNRSLGGWYAIDHPLEGFDVYFDRAGDGQQTKYSGETLADKPTPVADRHMEYVDRNPIPEVLIWRDYDEVKRLFEGRSLGEEAEPADEPRVSTRHTHPGRPGAEDLDDEPRRGDRRPPYRRPTSASQPTTNGADEPPFDTDEPPRAAPSAPRTAAQPEPAPSSEGRVRADQVRARFMNRRT